MNTRDLERIIYREPFQPYRLFLSGGEQILVDRPRKAVMSGGQVALVGVSRFANGAGREGLRIIPVNRVEAIEALSHR